jgi:2-polyprenyl-6-methoxyphenol hydroxylase-like FAD-dependent oxidoreductase
MTTSCCVAGCGPAGALVGYLLARAGVPVVVLEKHGDFLRDFRGDTIHPSTLEILDELGLADRFLKLSHSKVSKLTIQTTTGQKVVISLERLRSKFPFIALVPQWDFLEFLTSEAARFRAFRLIRNAEVIGLLETDGVIRGVRYRDAEGEHSLEAPLTIGADGRASMTRQAANLPQVQTAAPMDVFWFRVSRHPGELTEIGLRLGTGLGLVLLDRNDYWQVAYLIPKDAADRVRHGGLDAFRTSIVSVVPALGDRVAEIRDWDQVKLLTVRADRLTRWHRPGYLAIGDAAHAMSPVGGVGINIAIHDATVAANMLWRPLSTGTITESDLARVQRGREFAVRVIQAFQSAVQAQVIRPMFDANKQPSLPWMLRAIVRVPILRDLPARLIAFGIHRPHVESGQGFAQPEAEEST